MTTAQQTVIFVDLLGFSALIEQYPDEVVVETDGDTIATGTSPSASMFNRFHSVITQTLSDQVRDGQTTLMIFSDCAFVVLATPLLAAVKAGDLMRNFIKARVPVRMGMAKGTFSAQRFSIDMISSSRVQRSMFSGTGVVWAHRAERCGAKGMRVFIHPSLESDIHTLNLRRRVVPLPDQLPHASWELEYLHDVVPASFAESAAIDKDHELMVTVEEMRSRAPRGEWLHYDDTIAALNRMSVALGRGHITSTKTPGADE